MPEAVSRRPEGPLPWREGSSRHLPAQLCMVQDGREGCTRGVPGEGTPRPVPSDLGTPYLGPRVPYDLVSGIPSTRSYLDLVSVIPRLGLNMLILAYGLIRYGRVESKTRRGHTWPRRGHTWPRRGQVWPRRGQVWPVRAEVRYDRGEVWPCLASVIDLGTASASGLGLASVNTQLIGNVY